MALMVDPEDGHFSTGSSQDEWKQLTKMLCLNTQKFITWKQLSCSSYQNPCDLVVKHCMLGNIWQQMVLVSFEVERRHSSKVKEIIKGSHNYLREKQFEQLNKASLSWFELFSAGPQIFQHLLIVWICRVYFSCMEISGKLKGASVIVDKYSN